MSAIIALHSLVLEDHCHFIHVSFPAALRLKQNPCCNRKRARHFVMESHLIFVCILSMITYALTADETSEYKTDLNAHVRRAGALTPEREVGGRGLVRSYARAPHTVESRMPSTCGRRFSRKDGRRAKILSGTVADPGDFPWQISLQKRNKNHGGDSQWMHICGASLITKTSVRVLCPLI